MKIQASTVLSFITGRLYSDTAPTILFADLLQAMSGRNDVQTMELPSMQRNYCEKLLNQLDSDFKSVCQNWEHSKDWREKVAMIDEAFGLVEVNRCQ